jgi:large subunit ribosomal protein L15
MKLGDLHAPKGANKDRKRVGRGHGSGHVKTAGRGTKGQKSRTGGNVPPRFMGGQTPIHQQLPYKRGFTHIWKIRYNLVNLGQLNELEANAEVTPESLLKLGLSRHSDLPLKVLGNGNVDKALKITAHKVSESARQKIEAAGGNVTLIEAAKEPKRPRGTTMAPVRAREARAAEKSKSS